MLNIAARVMLSASRRPIVTSDQVPNPKLAALHSACVSTVQLKVDGRLPAARQTRLQGRPASCIWSARSRLAPTKEPRP
jgi:hypothetical protein